MFEILENAEFKEETCDGLPNYYIKVNSQERENYKTFGLEMYNDEAHITFKGKGEAILSEEQTNRIKTIIDKYFG